jgi:hypothetical protein
MQRVVKEWVMSLLEVYVRETFCPKARVGLARGFVRSVACFKTYVLTQLSPFTFLMALGLHHWMERNEKCITPDNE